jgi:type IV secretory pathway TraG/TraD family ATPase VirD4
MFSKKINHSKSNIPINKKLSIPFECENRHFLVIGKPGSGKTQLLNRAIEKITERGDKTIIYDLKGDFIAHFYNPKTDIIFNPIDKRSVGWCLFNDVSDLFSLESVCSSLVPQASSDPFWNNAARDVLYSCLFYCLANGLKTNADIHSITIDQTDELIKKFKTVEGCERGIRPLLESKMAASVLSTFSQYVKCFEYLKQSHGDFSIKNWISDENQKGKIFITNYTEISDTLKPILSLFIDIAVNRVLMLPENLSRRIFVFLDEFGTLQRLNNIPNLLKLSRSYGGSAWLGVQDIGQIDAIYGRDLTKTIINSCANNFIYGVAEPQTAELLSRKIGDNETKNINEN